MSLLSGHYKTQYESIDIDGRSYVNQVHDFETEYDAVRNGIALMDYSDFGVIKVSGEDACAFMQRVTTKDFEYFAPERTRICMMLDFSANVIAVVNAMNFEDYYYILVYPGQINRTLQWLNGYCRNTDIKNITIEDMRGKLSAIAIEGPLAWKVTETFIPNEISSLAFMSFVNAAWDHGSLTIARMGYAGEYGYIFFGEPNAAAALWDEIESRGQPYGIKHCGLNVFKTCMQEVRVPNLDVELPPGASIFESRLQWLIDFTKVNYIGYEIVQELLEAEPRKGIIGFTCEMRSAVSKGDGVYAEDESIGTVLSCYESPTLSKNIGLALVDNIFAQAGLSLTVGGVEIQTVSCPYIVPRSWTEKIDKGDDESETSPYPSFESALDADLDSAFNYSFEDDAMDVI
jgi:aminomethyltransferase